jgi:hypothetical protein
MKQAVREVQRNADNLKEFQENLQQRDFCKRSNITETLKLVKKIKLKIWINEINNSQNKNGFLRKNVGFSLSSIDSDLGDLIKSLSQSSVNNDAGNPLKKANESNRNCRQIIR